MYQHLEPMHHSSKLYVLRALEDAHCAQVIQQTLLVLRRQPDHSGATIKLSRSGVQRLLLTSAILHSYSTLLPFSFHSVMTYLTDRSPAVLFLVNLR